MTSETRQHRDDNSVSRAEGGSQLAGCILGRYSASPGVIPMERTLKRGRRISRMSAGRLPLLAALQRRWSMAEPPFPPGLARLPFAQPPVFAGGPRPAPAHEVGTASEASDSTSLAPARLGRSATARPGARGGEPTPTLQAATPGGRIGRMSAGRLPLLAAIQRRWSTAEDVFPPGPGPRPPLAHGVQTASEASDPTSLAPDGPEPSVTPRPAARGGEPTPALQAATPGGRISRMNTGRLPLLAAIQRRWSTAEDVFPPGLADAVQAAPEASGPTSLAPVGLGPSATARSVLVAAAPRPAVRGGGQTPTIQTATPGGTSTGEIPAFGGGDAGAARTAPTARAGGREGVDLTLQRQGKGPGPASGQEPGASGSPDAASPVSSIQGAPQPGGVHLPAGPGPTRASGLGAVVLQRYLGGPAGRAIQRRAGSHPRGHTTAAGVSAPSALTARILGAAPHAMPLAAIQTAAAGESGDDGFSSIGRQTLAQQAAPQARRALGPPPVVDQPATAQPRMDRVAPMAVPGAHRSTTTATRAFHSGTGPAGHGAGWMPVSRAATGIGESLIWRQIEPPLAKFEALPGSEPHGGAFRWGTSTRAASPNLPLARSMRRGAATAGVEPVAPAGVFGQAVGPSVQRAGDEAPVSLPTAESSGVQPGAEGETPAPTPAPPDSREGPDLERLADEVITIIERRLTIQRESMGL
jgi:hypothetical protein